VIQNLLLYYFSGTGNALTATRWISANAEKEGIQTSVYSIENMDSIAVPELVGKTLIGICYPTHGFCAPWLVIKFFAGFPRIPNTTMFFLNTRGGLRLGHVSIPGLSGIATWLPMLWFWLKDMKTMGVLPLDMPHSWTSFLPPNSQASSRRLIEQCHNTVNVFSSNLIAERSFFSPNIWYSLPFDIAVFPIGVLYFFCGRFFLGKTLFASFECDTCRVCEQNCPVGAIKIIHNRPYWGITCESCQRCVNICPKKSIQAWYTRIAIIACLLIVLGIWLWPFNYYIWLVLVTLSIFPLYRLFHTTLGVRWINKAFSYTSLTRYWKRYLAPGIKVKDLKKSVISHVTILTNPSTDGDKAFKV
jgi:ferredoxin